MPAYLLRLPESVRKAAETAAARDGVSLNQFFATAIAEKAAALTTARAIEERAARADRSRFDEVMARVGRADRSRFDEVMARVGREPPREGDEPPP